MGLRHVWTVGSALLAAGVFASAALADGTGGGVTVGGATAPVNITSTGATGATGATGTIAAPSTVTAPLAPIVLAKGQSPSLAYSGPVYVETATGALAPFVPQTTVASVSGGTVAGTPTTGPLHLVVPGDTAEVVQGIAAAPEAAPLAVQEIIWAADKIVGRPYVYGGGHHTFASNGYDCSGTVSYALHGARLLRTPLDSSQLTAWGRGGQGQWVTILSNAAHAYLDVAGLRLDTSAADDPSNQQGPRWRPLRTGNAGYTLRHPAGL